MLEDLLWFTNVVMLAYVCGCTYLDGCNSQKAKKDDTYRDDHGECKKKFMVEFLTCYECIVNF